MEIDSFVEDFWRQRGILDEETTARILGVSTKTLDYWRVENHGPPYIKYSGKIIRYLLDDIVAWMQAKRIVPDPGKRKVKLERTRKLQLRKRHGEFAEHAELINKIRKEAGKIRVENTKQPDTKK